MNFSINDFISILGYVLTPVTGVVTYFFTKKKKDNDFLKDLQNSINLLTDENYKLMQEVLTLRCKIIENSEITMKLRTENTELGLKIEVLEAQNKKLQEEVAELNNKLNGVQINKIIKNGK